MEIAIIAPAFYSSEDRVHYLVVSAERHNLKLNLYGQGEPFKDWIDTHITSCLTVIKDLRLGITHVLFTDAADAIFLEGVAEIRRRYQRLGHPPLLMSVEHTHLLNAGGWLAEVDVAIAALSYLATDERSGDPQVRWRNAISEGHIRATLDWGRNIFRVTGADDPATLAAADTCVLHFAGGYTDPKRGKRDQIEPVWRLLGYDIR